MKTTAQIRGFSLIEVMIALVILAVGILGLSKLQGTLIRSGSDANQRTVAMSIIQQKVDDLKSFANLTVGTATDAIPDNWVVGIAANLLAYEHIADSEGGQIASADAATPIPRGNYAYTLDWDVEEYYHTAANALVIARTAAQIVTDGDTVPANSDYKLVTVTVGWTDEAGAPQSVALSTVIDAYAPALTALADNPNSLGGGTIDASYTPEAAPDVIDIGVDTGGGKLRQTSKPLPDAVATGSNSNILVTFEVITYHENPLVSAEFFADRQEEFQTVDCSCSLSSSAATAYPPGHVVWDADDNDRFDVVGSALSKATATQVNNANAVDEACTACCRDHHDDDASTIKYVAGTSSGDHAHYKTDGTVAAAGDEYMESCRFKRIDGVMRVFQDWKLLDLTVMNRDDLGNLDPLQIQYTAYVTQLLKDQAESTSLAVQPLLRTPLDIPLPDAVQLESRGVYIDDVYDISTDALSTEYATYIADNGNVDRLERIPFAEVNLSRLSLWSSAESTMVSVTNDAVATISDPAASYYGTYSRGEITPIVNVASPGVNITSTIGPGNDGITQLAVNLSPAPVKSDTIAVTVTGVSTSITVSGSVDGTGLPGGTEFTMTGCILASNGNFSCTYSSGSDVNIAVLAFKKNTVCDPAGGGSFSQSNVTSDLTGISISLTCP